MEWHPSIIEESILDTEYHGKISISYFLEKHHQNLVKYSDKNTVFTMIGHINMSYSVVIETSHSLSIAACIVCQDKIAYLTLSVNHLTPPDTFILPK